jgi:hypothetical protein
VQLRRAGANRTVKPRGIGHTASAKHAVSIACRNPTPGQRISSPRRPQEARPDERQAQRAPAGRVAGGESRESPGRSASRATLFWSLPAELSPCPLASETPASPFVASFAVLCLLHSHIHTQPWNISRRRPGCAVALRSTLNALCPAPIAINPACCCVYLGIEAVQKNRHLSLERPTTTTTTNPPTPPYSLLIYSTAAPLRTLDCPLHNR